MCRIGKAGGETVIFDANVLESEKEIGRGFRTIFGILTIPSQEKEILEKECLR